MAVTPPPLFQPFRALGYITDDVPFAVQRRGKETFVTVSVGKAWQVYNCGKLTLVLVGPQLNGTIRALAAINDLTFSAVGRDIVVCKRVHRFCILRGHAAGILQLLVMGDYLLSLGSDGQLLTWRLPGRSSTEEVHHPLASMQLPAGFKPTCMAHPDTYINKIVIGSEGGQMALVNFMTGSLIYTFPGYGSAVRGLTPSPALDVMGIALADGRAALHDLRRDETVAVFANAAGAGLSDSFLLGPAVGSTAAAAAAAGAGGQGACRALAFRTGPGVPLMAAAGGAGVITVWDLEQRRLHTVIKDAHDAPVVSLHFFAGEPLLMSAGADNAVKHWVFDSAEPVARMLRFRSGHAAPPTTVRHYGEGLRLLTAGSDRAFRVFSTIQDQQSRELTQKGTAKRAKRLKVRESELKLARVTAMDACTVRERDWANVITAHEGDPVAYVWRLEHFTLGEHELSPPPPESSTAAAFVGTAGRRNKRRLNSADNVLGGPPPPLPGPHGGARGAPVSSVALSPCGNFGIVGSSSGRVDRYNMQSGIHRGVYGRVPQPSEQQDAQGRPIVGPGTGVAAEGPAAALLAAEAAAAALRPAHDGAVTGVAVDSCNRLMVSAGTDAVLRLWDFRSMKLRGEVPVGSPVTHLSLHPGTCLAAVACDDNTLRVFDVEAGGRLVRRFKGHKDRITGLQLSADSRWLLSSSMDGALRVWDVPAARCLQVIRLGAPITAFSLSPALDMLATCHINRRGVYLWSNQAVFGNPADFVHSEVLVNVGLPTMAGQADKQGASHNQRQQDSAAAAEGGERKSKVQIAGLAAGAGDGGDAEQKLSVSIEQEELQGPGGLALEEPDSSDEDEENYFTAPESAAATQSQQGQQGGGEAKSAGEDATAAAGGEGRIVLGSSGAPEPLEHSLVTLSLLPRAQWQSLVALEAIKARNKPIQPPKKPESAPFFLPTVASLAGNPVFDPSAAPAADESAQGPGDAAAAAGSGRTSQVLRKGASAGTGAAADALGLTPFVRLLRAGAEAGDYASFMAYLRTLTPAAVDREVRALQILAFTDGQDQEEDDEMTAAAVHDIRALLECIDGALAAGHSFEYCQALLQLVLQVHGDAIMERPPLKAVAQRLHTKLRPVWSRLDDLLQECRCMVSFFGHLQQ